MVNQDIDKKYSKVCKKGRSPKVNILPEVFFTFAEEYSLVDAWRTRNIKSNGFSYFSHRHDSWFRIDMCWMSMNLMKDINEIDFLPRSFAGLNPL